jgi:hypothetical protein
VYYVAPVASAFDLEIGLYIMFTQLQSKLEMRAFTQFIRTELAKDDYFLHRTFWTNDAQQQSILNYLIMAHEKGANNLSQQISWLLTMGASIDSGQPIHLAFKLKKLDLITLLLDVVQEQPLEPEQPPQPLIVEERERTQDHPAERFDLVPHQPLSEAPLLIPSHDRISSSDEGGEDLMLGHRSHPSLHLSDDEESDSSRYSHFRIPSPKPYQFARLAHQPRKPLDLNSRDEDGKTLIFRAIELGHVPILVRLLETRPNVDQASAGLQPLHQAILKNFASGVDLLVKANAQVTNPYGHKKETPLLLAARYGHIDALGALLKHVEVGVHAENPLDTENLPGKGKRLKRPIDFLCHRLSKNIAPKETIRGIAMLLCHGATPPERDKWLHLLRDHRKELLQAVATYAKADPALAAKFIRAAHFKQSKLHEIIYADHTIGTSVNHFFGIASAQAIRLESLIPIPDDLRTLKWQNWKAVHGSHVIYNPHTNRQQCVLNPHNKTGFTREEVLFAVFVREYDSQYKSDPGANRYSKMRFALARGHICCWEDLVIHCKKNPKSRSADLLLKLQTSMNARYDEEVFESDEENERSLVVG